MDIKYTVLSELQNSQIAIKDIENTEKESKCGWVYKKENPACLYIGSQMVYKVTLSFC